MNIVVEDPPSPEILPDDAFCRIADRLKTAIWVFDFDHCRVLWANTAALAIWNAETIEMLSSRDLSIDMSPAVRTRVRQYQTDLIDPERSFNEVWTLYPGGQARTLNICFRGYTLGDGRLAMICEGTVARAREPDAIISAQALLHTPVKISLFTELGDPLYLNPAARSTQADLEMSLVERFCCRRTGEHFLSSLVRDQQCKVVTRVRTIDGDRWHEINASRCRDAATGDLAFLVSEIDVTDLKETEQRAEAADVAKSEFLTNMSHELRTPLNAIIGFSDFIQSAAFGDPVPPRIREYVGSIHQSGEHLLGIINDILDLARIETGEMTFSLEQVQIAEVFRSLKRLMSMQAVERGVRLVVSPVDDDLSIWADGMKVKQIIVNLLSNAIKFTETGGTVFLSASVEGDKVGIMIGDTGIGMSESDILESFKPFRQVENSISRRFEGTGLGLPLSKNLVEEQGGTLSIRSKPGCGTEVTVRLSRHAARAMNPEGDLCAVQGAVS